MDKETAKQRIEERKVKKAKKCYRCRGLKNFLFWFTGVLSSFAIVAVGIFVGVKVIPVKTYLGSQTDGIVSEEISSKSILDAIMGYKTYKVSDIPAIENALKELTTSSGLSTYVEIDFDKLGNVQFVYESGETNFVTELQSCIKVTATVESVGGGTALGDLGKLEVFSEWTKIVDESMKPNVDASGNIIKEGETFKSNPKLYYYVNNAETVSMSVNKGFDATITDTNNYERAFDDNGVRVAPEGAELYLPNLSKIPLLDVVDVLDERLGTTKIADLLGIFGEIPADSPISKIMGDYTIGTVGDITPETIKIYDILGGEPDGQIYKILGSATAIDGVNTPYNEITLDKLTNADFNIEKIKISDIMSEITETDTLYKILTSATGQPFNDIKISDMTGAGFNVNNVKIMDIVGGSPDDTIYKILGSATAVGGVDTPADQITIDKLVGSNLNIENVKLSAIIEKAGNEKFFDLLYSATGKAETEEITVKDLTSIKNFDNIELVSVLDYAGNEKLYNILLDVTNRGKAPAEQITYDKLKISDLTGFNINNLNLGTILPESENGNIYKILRDATGKTNIDDEILISDLSGFNANNIKLKNVLDPATNKGIYDILIDALQPENPMDGVVTADNITINTFANFNVQNIKLNSVLPEKGNETIYKILKDATGKTNTGDVITMKDLGSFNINNVKLSNVIEEAGNEDLYKLLKDVTGKTNNVGDEIYISDFGSLKLTNLKLNTVVPEESNTNLYKLLKDATGKTNTVGDEILVSDLTAFNVSDIKLSSVMTSSDNSVLKELLKDDSVTIGNLGSKINNLSISSIFDGTACFSKVVHGAEYSKLTGNGKTYFVLRDKASAYASANGLTVVEGGYYISENATMWLFIQYEKLDISGTINEEGYANGYMDKNLTISTMGSGMKNISTAFMNASIRELNVSGVLTGSYNAGVYSMSLQEMINKVNALPIIP